MPPDFPAQLFASLSTWWKAQRQARGALSASVQLLRQLWEFARDSTPQSRRSRYGDMEYDWEHRFDTTSGTVGWRERLLGIFHSAYQPTDPAVFREMISALPIDLSEFTFLDIGSGKGRALLLAAEYPFREILGVELIPALHRAAEANIAAYAARTPTANAPTIKSVCMDAREFVFPKAPLIVYLFNPLPEAGLRQVLRNLESSWNRARNPVWIIYHAPDARNVLDEFPFLTKEKITPEYAVFRTPPTQPC